MKKSHNTSARASALQITMAVALMAVVAILFATSFKAAPPEGSKSSYKADEAKLRQEAANQPVSEAPVAPATTSRQNGFYPPLPEAPNTFCGTFTNPAAISIPSVGNGAPYPSTITVAAVSGNITAITVKLNGLTHTFPSDIDVLLVGPGGQNAVIMSDVGSSSAVTNVSLILDDTAANIMPAGLLGAPNTTQTYQPTNSGVGDPFPAPAPTPVTGASALSAFNGVSPNGTWSLYVVDDASGDLGQFAGGWELNVSTDTCAGGTPAPTATPTPTASPTATVPATVCTHTEGFDDITNLPFKGYFQQNNSSPIGVIGWFQGTTSVFCGQSGACNSYIGSNFNNGAGLATISNWLLTPPVTLQNGGVLTFWTRTVDAPSFPDRLQVRMSTNLTSTNVGTAATDVGDFTTLLLDINSGYSTSGYPSAWTQFFAVVTGLGSPVKGRLAFRYFVENGGPSGANSDYIGIDTVSYDCVGVTPTPGPTGTPSPVPTASPTPTASATPTATATPILTPTPPCGGASTIFSQNFDSVVAPALPAGWVASNPVATDGIFWVTSTSTVNTGPNAAFSNEPAAVNDKVLDTPVIAIPSQSVRMTFSNNFNVESGFDGAVLELSINGGAFTDIITAGGSFVAGGYTGTISTAFSSTIGGRNAWTGTSGGYISTSVNLPLSTAGQNIQLRFRMCSDSSVSGAGWHVDDVGLTGCPITPTPTPTGTPTPTATPCPVSFSENFDGVVAPALPAGWVATNTIDPDLILWVTTTTGPDTAPNSAFANDPAAISDKNLDSPSIAIGSPNARVTFRNNYTTESTFDGGVLEISINGGAFADIITAGGSFITGGYNGVISTAFSSPISGRSAWTGASAGYLTTVAQLPAAAAGQPVKLRWRMASDSSVGSTGWNIDGVTINDCSGSTPSPSPQPTFSITGNVSNCASPAPTATPPATPTPPTLPPTPNVLMTLSGSASGTTLTDGSGNYSFTGLLGGGSYTITPSKPSLAPASAGINTLDVLAIQRHFLLISVIPAGCRLTAADVNINSSVNTQDVLAVQRFFLGFTSGTASTGQYKFTPANRTYPSLGANQTAQNYVVYVLGDVAAPFNNRPGGPSPDMNADADMGFSTVASVTLPNVALTKSASSLTAAVKSTAIDANERMVGFQGDFTFDERVVQFASEPVQKAGLTAGNWTVAGNVLPGNGPIRTLRISAFSNDFAPLKGAGTLFELKMERVSRSGEGTPLVWSAPPDNFIFINADLQTQRPGNAEAGSVSQSSSQR